MRHKYKHFSLDFQILIAKSEIYALKIQQRLSFAHYKLQNSSIMIQNQGYFT